MGKKKICSACGTENREDFQFCINCGARLPIYGQTVTESVETSFTSTPPEQPTAEPMTMQPFYAPPVTTGTMSELDETAAFVGPNGYEYAQKMQFMKMQYKKASWNWPVFLFGFLLKIPFVWFYYRRMYKQATIILLATLVFMLGNIGCCMGIITPVFDAVSHSIKNTDPAYGNSAFVDYHRSDDKSALPVGIHNTHYKAEDYDDFQWDNDDLKEFESLINANLSSIMLNLIGICVLSVGYLIFVILLAVYANNMYARHCQKKIQFLKSVGRCDLISLRSAGGTSTVAAVLSGILFSIGMSVVSSVLVSSSMSSLFLTIAGSPY